MNRHPGLFSLALLGIALTCSLTASSLGQAPPPAAPPAPVPAPAGPPGNIDALKSSPNVATAVPLIAGHIKTQVAALTGGDPTAASKARDELIDNVSPGRVAPSPAFLAEFARQLDTGIAPALQHENEYVRLNAGIVVAKAAERTDNAALRGATLALLNDKSRNVVLWGVKSARWVIPAILRSAGKADDVLGAVVKAVATHGQGAIGGPIVVEAYEALTIDALNNNAKRRPTAAMITTVIPYMHQLLQQRVLAYQKGIPPEPAAESRGTLFLVDGTVWGLHTPPQRVTSIQAMSDIIGLGAQHAAANPPAGDLADLGYMIGLVSKAIAVVPQNAPIKAQLDPAMKVDQRTLAPAIQAAVATVAPALKTVKEFAAITPPPAITPAAAPANNGTATTTAPTIPTTAATAPATTASASP
jgi:hypothetical protein